MSKEIEALVDAFENAVIEMERLDKGSPHFIGSDAKDRLMVQRRRVLHAYRTTKANLLEAMCV